MEVRLPYKVAAAARVPEEAFVWAAKIGEAQSVDEMAQNGSLFERRFANPDSQMAIGLVDVLEGKLKRKVARRKVKCAPQNPPQQDHNSD